MADRVFTLKTTGDDKAAGQLNAIGGRGADARPAWPLVFAVLRSDTEQRFDKQGEGLWPKLKESTVARKEAEHLDPRIMRASGALYRSLTITRGKGAIRRGLKTQLRYGTSVYYARFHQIGKGVPERPLVVVDDEVERRITQSLQLWVTRGVLPRPKQ